MIQVRWGHFGWIDPRADDIGLDDAGRPPGRNYARITGRPAHFSHENIANDRFMRDQVGVLRC